MTLGFFLNTTFVRIVYLPKKMKVQPRVFLPTIWPRTASVSVGFNLHRSKRWSANENWKDQQNTGEGWVGIPFTTQVQGTEGY